MKTTTKQNKKTEWVKSIAWLIEATFRGFVGYMLLAHFTHQYVAVGAGVYSLATGGLIVITHFVKAHK